jgi:hypothetical protein
MTEREGGASLSPLWIKSAEGCRELFVAGGPVDHGVDVALRQPIEGQRRSKKKAVRATARSIESAERTARRRR